MEMQELEIHVEKDGNVTVHVKGVKGGGCLSVTRSIEDALGKVTDRSLTPEHFEDQLKEYIPCRVREF